MKINETIKIYIIIGLIVMLIITGVFGTCSFFGNSGTGTEITRGLQFVTDRIRKSINLLSSIKGSVDELISERDNYKQLTERLRTEIDRTEQINTELQENNRKLREQQSKTIEAIRRIVSASNGIGKSIDTIGTGLDGIAEFISGLQERTK